MMNGPKLDHEHEQRLAATRDHWMSERDNVERELIYARRTVEALSVLLTGLDNAIASTQPKETLASGPVPGYANKSYEVGSGEKYFR
jgi:hypothetical protein